MPSPVAGASPAMSRRTRPVFPVKLNDGYTCQGIDAEGDSVVFGDLLSEGTEVASYVDRGGNAYGPMHTVVRKEDGLWVI